MKVVDVAKFAAGNCELGTVEPENYEALSVKFAD
jgi:hypothetical protein